MKSAFESLLIASAIAVTGLLIMTIGCAVFIISGVVE